MIFGCRTLSTRIEKGTRQSVTLEQVPVMFHVYVRNDGLLCIVVTDKEYPVRVAFVQIQRAIEEFEKLVQGRWKQLTTDQDSEPPFIRNLFNEFQNPRADKLQNIQCQLDDIKGIMHQNIESLIERGESLDSLLEKSTDISNSSKQFYKQARKANSCCRTW